MQVSTNMALARGDTLTVTGSGYQNDSVAIWGIGPSFFTYQTLPVDQDGMITWTLGRDTTRTLRSGPLYVIIQDPGNDRDYAVRPTGSAGDPYTRIFRLENDPGFMEITPGNLSISGASNLAEQLRDRIAGSGMDDSCTLLMAFVEEPALHIDAKPDEILLVPAGQDLRLTGTMNLAPENRITARIESTAVIGKTGNRIPVEAGVVTPIRTGELKNRWEYTLNTSGLSPGEYLLGIGWDQSRISGQSAMLFRIAGNPDPAADFVQKQTSAYGARSETTVHTLSSFPLIRDNLLLLRERRS